MNQADYPITTMCRLLGVSTSGYYAWVDRGPSTRDEANARLLETINGIHQQSRRTYGAPRITAELREEGHLVGKNRVARLMKVAGIEGVSRRRKTRTTLRGQDSRPAPDLVERNFQVSRPNRLWVADITYVPSWAGFVYLAVVVDAFSRRVVGWSLRHDLKTRLARIDHRFGNEGDFGRPERFSESFATDSVQVEWSTLVWRVVNGAFFGFGRA